MAGTSPPDWKEPDFTEAGERAYALAAKLYPICRSITGNGVRETLALMRRHIDLEVHEVPTGTKVLDWTISKEWNIRAGHIKDARGNTIVDFANSNLHVMSYSVPVRKDHGACRVAQASVFAARSARSNSLPHQLLDGDLGLLPAASASRVAARGRLRGADRLDAD